MPQYYAGRLELSPWVNTAGDPYKRMAFGALKLDQALARGRDDGLQLGVDLSAGSPPFCTEVLELKALYMLHADHTLDHCPAETAGLTAPGKRGTGAEIRILSIQALEDDPNQKPGRASPCA